MYKCFYIIVQLPGPGGGCVNFFLIQTNIEAAHCIKIRKKTLTQGQPIRCCLYIRQYKLGLDIEPPPPPPHSGSYVLHPPIPPSNENPDSYFIRSYVFFEIFVNQTTIYTYQSQRGKQIRDVVLVRAANQFLPYWLIDTYKLGLSCAKLWSIWGS